MVGLIGGGARLHRSRGASGVMGRRLELGAEEVECVTAAWRREGDRSRGDSQRRVEVAGIESSWCIHGVLVAAGKEALKEASG